MWRIVMVVAFLALLVATGCKAPEAVSQTPAMESPELTLVTEESTDVDDLNSLQKDLEDIDFEEMEKLQLD